MSWIPIATVAGLGVITCVIVIAVSKRRRPRIERPPESGSGWSNNAIRKHGEKGKGIR